MIKEKEYKINQANHTNQMNQGSDNMKKGWEIKKFEDCLEKVVYTNKIQKKDFKEKGVYPIVSQEKDFINGYWDNEDDLLRVDGPVVIFGDHTQVIKFVDFDFVLGADGVKILKPKDKVDPKYFYYFLQNIDLGSLGYARHYRLLKEINIAYPKSLPEQQRIVAILDQAFTAIARAKANAEQNLKNAKELFEVVLDSILYNKKLKIEQLGNICEKVEYGTSLKSKSEGKLPVLRMGNIKNGSFVWDNLVYSDNEEDNKKYLLKHNDVLFNRTNSPELVGKTAIYKSEQPAIFPGYLIRIHRKENLLDPDYLNYYLNSRMAFDYGKTVVISSVNQANINGTKLKTYPIPLPSLKEQQTIVRQLDDLRTETKKLEAVYQKKIGDLEELKKSILQKACSGGLNYDFND
ncbi:MAG: restriction endonuclease subunit S [Bacteroidetes bacterium]|nr:restriction endonuclease subunit S [Bacteroidota bacterium]